MNDKLKIEDITSVLVHINGPTDEAVYKTSKYSHDQYDQLLEKLYKDSKYDFSETDKAIVVDALRIFLEGIMDGDVTAVTGKDKAYFLNLYGYLLKEWGINTSKLKRQSYDSPEYQNIATQSGLVE